MVNYGQIVEVRSNPAGSEAVTTHSDTEQICVISFFFAMSNRLSDSVEIWFI